MKWGNNPEPGMPIKSLFFFWVDEKACGDLMGWAWHVASTQAQERQEVKVWIMTKSAKAADQSQT